MRAGRIQDTKQESKGDLSIQDWTGLSLFDPHSTLASGELRDATNIDLYPGYVKGRYGSSTITGLDHKFGSNKILNAKSWDVGADEYLIIQATDSTDSYFYVWEIADEADPVLIQKKDLTGDFVISGLTESTEMFINNNRLYGFSSSENFVIEYDGADFVQTQMGLPLPAYDFVSGVETGKPLSGEYIWAVELCYIISPNTYDTLASSPNRFNTSNIIQPYSLEGEYGYIKVNSDVLDADTLWTHIRLYRSKRLDPTLLGAQQIDVVGSQNELYACQLVAKDDFITGYTNENGDTCGAYEFIDWLLDENIPNKNANAWYPVYTTDRMELSPVSSLKARIGTYHKERLWFGGIEDTTFQSRVYYTSYAGTPYACQYVVDQYKDIDSNDGQKIIKLISFEKDLVAIKESKTCELIDGNIDLQFDTTDFTTGIENAKCAHYIPGTGICAITNDQRDFKIYGYNKSWNNVSGVEVSRTIRTITKSANISIVSIIYLNGKIWLSLGTSIVYVLHKESNKGWTKYEYPTPSDDVYFFTYKNNTKALYISADSYMIQVDDSTTNQDIDPSDDVLVDIYGSITTHQFSVANGRSVLDFQRLSVIADLSDNLTASTYVNGLPWPTGISNTSISFIMDPQTYIPTVLRQGEYSLVLEPPRPLANYLHFNIITKIPFTINNVILYAIVDNGFRPNFDPFQYTAFHKVSPGWGNNVMLHLPYDELIGDIANDISGNQRNHTWNEGDPAGTHSYEFTLAPGGGQDIGAGTDSYYGDSNWTALDLLGTDGYFSDAMTFEKVIYNSAIPEVGYHDDIVVFEAGNGTSMIRMIIKSDDSLEFIAYTFDSSNNLVLNKKFYTAANTAPVGAVPYTIQFVLSNGGLNGQFYCGLKTGSTSEILTQSTTLV